MNVLLVYPKCPDSFWSFSHALSTTTGINYRVSNAPVHMEEKTGRYEYHYPENK